ncbi:hypothetical protein A2U01_0077457, partial [Trifolium medium]|nr:hypothetical protein [Trifolium medium]
RGKRDSERGRRQARGCTADAGLGENENGSRQGKAG